MVVEIFDREIKTTLLTQKDWVMHQRQLSSITGAT